MERSSRRILVTHTGSLPRPKALVALHVARGRGEGVDAAALATAIAAHGLVLQVDAVDPTRVLAGTDCGFDTAAGLGGVASEIVWEKLAAPRAGADLAGRRLLAA